MDYLGVEENLKEGYRRAWAQYRRDDEVEVRTENHRRLARRLKSICLSFTTEIDVLDVGCGTGRFFHCLCNVRRLTGIDISEQMLAAAKDPVMKDELTAPKINLIRCNAYLIRFPPHSFDFIYSIGMFGYGCPVTPEICARFHQWLKPGGKLFFNAVDIAGVRWDLRLRRRLKTLCYPWLPSRWQRRLDAREKRLPLFRLRKSQLRHVLSETPFQSFQIASQPCQSPLWKGRHLECLAAKTLGNC